MGDLLVCTPLFRAVKKASPGTKIYLLCSPDNAVAVSNNPQVDGSVVYDKKRWWNPFHALGVLRQLRSWRPDAAIQLLSNTASLTSALWGRASGVRTLIGFNPEYYGESWGQFLFHHTLSVEPHGLQPEVKTYGRLLQPLGIELQDLALEFHPSSEDREWVREWLGRLPPGKICVGLQPGGSDDPPGRLWPAIFYADIAKRIMAFPNAEVILIGMPGLEESAVRAVQRELPHPPVVFMERKFGRYAALLESLAVYCGNDGGGLHLAAACGTPTVGIFRAAKGARWNPFPLEKHPFLQSKFPGDDPTEIEQVWALLHSTLPPH